MGADADMVFGVRCDIVVHVCSCPSLILPAGDPLQEQNRNKLTLLALLPVLWKYAHKCTFQCAKESSSAEH